MFFAWVKNRVKEAVISGFSEAVSELDGGEEHGESARQLVARLRALPGPDEEEVKPVANGKRR